MKIFAVSIKYTTGYESKRDFDACELIYAQNQEEALAKVKESESEEEGYYDYKINDVNLDDLMNGKIIRIYGKYNW
jgi:hypothetical protein